MIELSLELLRIIGIIVCLGLPAYCLLKFDDPEW